MRRSEDSDHDGLSGHRSSASAGRKLAGRKAVSSQFRSSALSMEVSLAEQLEEVSLTAAFKDPAVVSSEILAVHRRMLDSIINSNAPFTTLLRRIKLVYEKSIAAALGHDAELRGPECKVDSPLVVRTSLEALREHASQVELSRTQAEALKLRRELQDAQRTIKLLSERALDANPVVIKNREMSDSSLAARPRTGLTEPAGSAKSRVTIQSLRERVAELQAANENLRVENIVLRSSLRSQAAAVEPELAATRGDPPSLAGDCDSDSDMDLFYSPPRVVEARPNPFGGGLLGLKLSSSLTTAGALAGPPTEELSVLPGSGRKLLPALNLKSLDLREIPSYQEEFLAKKEEFSLSWREALSETPL